MQIQCTICYVPAIHLADRCLLPGLMYGLHQHAAATFRVILLMRWIREPGCAHVSTPCGCVRRMLVAKACLI